VWRVLSFIRQNISPGSTIYTHEVNGAGAVAARYTQGLAIDEPLAMMRGGTPSLN